MAEDDSSIVERLRSVLKKGEYPGPAAERTIAEAEAALNVTFPRSYKAFLRHFGAAWLLPPMEVAGLGPGRHSDPDPPMWPHVVDVTAMMHRASGGHLPPELVLISGDGGDYKFYLDTSRFDSHNECPVIVLGPGRDGIIIANSFVEFVEKAMSEDFQY